MPRPKASPRHCPGTRRNLYWQATRASLRLGKRFSEGVKLGFDTGFDSGSTLDYVYRNQPTGKGKLGELIDRNYLDAIGWRGIRQRKLHAEELLRLAIAHLRNQGRAVHIVDIAAGHGRYILEALQGLEQRLDLILLRDYSELNVSQGNALISEKGLGEIACSVQGRCLRPAVAGQPRPAPDPGGGVRPVRAVPQQ